MWAQQPETPQWQERRQDVAQPPAPLQPLGAQCVAAETAVGRTACRLLSAVPCSPLLVAAAGPSLLLVSRTGGGSVLPLGVLFESSTGIAAVAVSRAHDQRRQWAAALEGGSATFCPIDTSGPDPAAFGGSPASPRPTSVSLRPGVPPFEALAWHPSEAVCALMAPHELLLVAPPGLQLTPRSGSYAAPASVHRRSSSSSGSEEEGGAAGGQPGVGSPDQGGTPKDTTWGTFRSGTVHGDWGSLSNGAAQSAATVLLALPSPMGAAGGAPAGRCCLAWLGSGGGGLDGWGRSAGGADDGGSGSGRRLVLSWGGHLELMEFDEGWHLLERRQLLPGLPGPICGLAGVGAGKLLAATERPVGQFLGGASEPSQQPQPGVLQRYLTAKESTLPPVVLPHMHTATLPGGAALAAEPPLQPLPASDGLIDLTGHHSNPFLTAPAPAAGAAGGEGPPIPSMFLLRPAHMPLAQGLPLLPSGSPPQQQTALGVAHRRTQSAVPALAGPAPGADGGHASLLWLGSGDACGTPDAALASPREHTVPLSCAGDLLQVHGDVAVLASSRAPPSLALCRLGRSGLQHLGSLPLVVPEGVPNGSTVRLRGLTLQAAERTPTNADGGGGQLLAWALLSVAQLGAAAPFLSASLSSRIYGSSRQQLWLACYPLPVEATVSEPAAPSVRGVAAYSAPAGAAGSTLASSVGSAPQRAAEQEVAAVEPAPPSEAEADAEVEEGAAPVLPLVLPGRGAETVAAAAAAAAAGTAAGGQAEVAAEPGCLAAEPAAVGPLPMASAAVLEQPGDAVAAVRALQRAVADMRQEVNARLDGLSAGLEQLLRTLRPDGRTVEGASTAARVEPEAAEEAAAEPTL